MILCYWLCYYESTVIFLSPIFSQLCVGNELDDLCTKIKIKLIRADVSKQSWQALIFIINTKILNHLIIYTKKMASCMNYTQQVFYGFFSVFRNFAAYIFVILRFSTHSDNIILIIFNFIYIIKVIKIWTLHIFFCIMCLNTILSCLFEDDKNSLEIFPSEFDWSISAMGGA